MRGKTQFDASLLEGEFTTRGGGTPNSNLPEDAQQHVPLLLRNLSSPTTSAIHNNVFHPQQPLASTTSFIRNLSTRTALLSKHAHQIVSLLFKKPPHPQPLSSTRTFSIHNLSARTAILLTAATRRCSSTSHFFKHEKQQEPPFITKLFKHLAVVFPRTQQHVPPPQRSPFNCRHQQKRLHKMPGALPRDNKIRKNGAAGRKGLSHKCHECAKAMKDSCKFAGHVAYCKGCGVIFNARFGCAKSAHSYRNGFNLEAKAKLYGYEIKAFGSEDSAEKKNDDAETVEDESKIKKENILKKKRADEYREKLAQRAAALDKEAEGEKNVEDSENMADMESGENGEVKDTGGNNDESNTNDEQSNGGQSVADSNTDGEQSGADSNTDGEQAEAEQDPEPKTPHPQANKPFAKRPPTVVMDFLNIAKEKTSVKLKKGTEYNFAVQKAQEARIANRTSPSSSKRKDGGKKNKGKK
ncbi:hypothetical protein K402DRAFT_454959 [Aulographum hederae CBS 113979]|uniref:Uncharacterized protein n=1 Tax=Aulographum hederae CBS 113979 TaxID=1176131 RepID=A0A6G1GY11_9PEZI|nr:hypothetical protein K402DRAFT_454959 [Aulographum hederae CBS 113979]